MSSLSLQSISKFYGHHAAVQNVDIEIAEGEFVVLLGPSGCGKTTTLRMIAGFVDPTEGRILLEGKDVTSLPPRHRNIGMVFQHYALFPTMTVAENVGYGLARRGAPKPEITRRVNELLDMVQLSAHAAYRPDELSGGQQQRVALARALAHTPKLLVMDEPLGALDKKLREQLQEDILLIQRDLRITTVFVTHDQHEALALADRIILMKDGTIYQQGNAEEIYLRPQNDFVAGFIGKRNLLEGDYLGNGKCRLTGGQLISVPQVSTLTEGMRVRLTVRPEALALTRTAEGAPSCLRATVKQRRFLGNIAGLVIAHCFVSIPYCIASISSILLRVDASSEEASIIHGASHWETFRLVTFPSIRPGLLAGTFYAFILSFGDVPIAIFLTGPNTTTLPVQIFQDMQFDFRPGMLAISTIIVVFSLVAIIGLQKLAGLDLVDPTRKI